MHVRLLDLVPALLPVSPNAPSAFRGTTSHASPLSRQLRQRSPVSGTWDLWKYWAEFDLSRLLGDSAPAGSVFTCAGAGGVDMPLRAANRPGRSSLRELSNSGSISSSSLSVLSSRESLVE